MTGQGGTAGPPPGYVPPIIPGVAAGSKDVVRARQVIVSGTNEGVFVYSGFPATGNLIATVTSAAGTDPYGNNYVQGVASYQPGGSSVANAIQGAALIFYSGSLAGGWTQEVLLDLTVPSTLAISATALSGVLNVPQSPPSLATLPNDTNSGSSWASGERAFMNTSWVANINANFTAILNVLAAAGIT